MIDLEGDLAQRLQRAAVIAVLVIEREADAVPLATALYEGGVSAMELTLRTPAALGALRAIRRQVPEMLAGIGTVLTTDQIDQVIAADAAFAVAPGCNPRVLEYAAEKGLAFAPGICTPSDVEQALAFDCRLLKFFPAEACGGLDYLRNMAAPYQHLGLRYIPLGGLRTSNAATYLADPLIWAIGGSWLAPKDRIAAGDWVGIRAIAAAAKAIADGRPNV